MIGILSAARDNLSLSLSCNARIVKNHDSFTRDIRTDIIHHRFERSVLNEIDIINLQIKLFDLAPRSILLGFAYLFASRDSPESRTRLKKQHRFQLARSSLFAVDR